MPTHPGNRIEKIDKGRGHIQFRITRSFNEIVRQQASFLLRFIVLFGLITAIIFFGESDVRSDGQPIFQVIVMLIWLGGISGGLLMAFRHIWGRTLLDLTPSWIQVRYELLGLGFSRQVPTASVTDMGVAGRYTIDNFDVQGIDIYAGRKTLKFGSHLIDEDKKWLVAEIKHYLSTIETPAELSGLTCKLKLSAQGIKIAMSTYDKSKRIGIFPLIISAVAGTFSIAIFVSCLQPGHKSIFSTLFTIFIGFWSFFWLIAEILRIVALVRNLFAKETIFFSQERLTLSSSGLWWANEQHFKIQHIDQFQLAPASFKGKEKLLLIYKGAIVWFCQHISDAEARTLLKHLTDILNFHCYAIERIIFGDIQTDGSEASSTSLHNPDVSDLTFPFVHLQELTIDAATHNLPQVEKFLTYAVNYIGRETLKNRVVAHIYGDAGQIHPNLRNTLQHLFKEVVNEHAR